MRPSVLVAALVFVAILAYLGFAVCAQRALAPVDSPTQRVLTCLDNPDYCEEG